MLKGESMFCPQCGAQNLDGAKFCASCGAPLASRLARPQASGAAGPQTPGMPQVPGQQGVSQVSGASSQPSQQPGVPQVPGAAPYGRSQWSAPVQPTMRRRVPVVPIVCAGVAVIAAIAALLIFVVLPPIQLAHTRFNGSVELSASGSTFLKVTGAGDTMTVSSALFSSSSDDEAFTGTVDSVTDDGDGVIYRLKNVTYSGSASEDAEISIRTPKGASSSKPYGKYVIVMSSIESGQRVLASVTFDYISDSKAKFEMAGAYGDPSDTSSVAWADATSDSYDPNGSHDNGTYMDDDLSGSSTGAGSSSFDGDSLSLDISVKA